MDILKAIFSVYSGT